MEAQIKLGRIFGVKIGLHYSWLIIAVLIAFSLAHHFAEVNPAWGTGVVWATAITTGLLFFAAIVAHELAHAMVARARNLPVRSITLFALGGVTHIEGEAADAKTEFWMGIAGPVMSLIIGAVCLGVAWAFGWQADAALFTPSTPLSAMLVWLGYINIALAVFNMIPGFPLDGGRVLRAIFWWTTGDGVRATRMAARVGQIVAFLFIIWGIFRFFGGAGFGGLWLAFIGWFLLDAARSAVTQVEVAENLRGVFVGDVMTRDCPVIDGRTNLQTFADEHLLRTGQRCFIVEEQGRMAGLVTPHEVKEVERSKWAFTTLDEVMRPLDRLRTVTPRTTIMEALEIMGREDVNQLPVVTDNRFVGILSRGHLLRLLQTRAELRTA